MSQLQGKFDITGHTSPNPTFQIASAGLRGPSTLTTQGLATKYPVVTLNNDGTIPSYPITAPVPGSGDPVAPLMYYYVKLADGTMLESGQFSPVETSTGVVDLNVLLTSGQAQAATPAQLTALNASLSQASTLLPQMTTSLATINAAIPDAQAAAAAKPNALAAAAANTNAQAAAALLPTLSAASTQAATDHTAALTAISATQQATLDALATTGISATYVSETTADPISAPDGTKGAKRDALGNLTRLLRVAGVWTAAGDALASLGLLNKRAPITPQQYGAVADGVTDDGAAIAAWQAYVVANPKGNYAMIGNFATSVPIDLTFAATGIETVRLSLGGTINSLITTYSDVLTIKNVSKLTIVGSLHVNGYATGTGTSYANRKNRCGIRFGNCSRTVIAGRISAYFFRSHGIAFDDRMTASNISSIVSWYCGSNGLNNAQSLNLTLTDIAAQAGTTGSVNQTQAVTVSAALGAEVEAQLWFALIKGRLHRITAIDSARTTLTLFPWVDPMAVIGDVITFVGGAGVYTTGGDSSTLKIGHIDAICCGIGYQPNSLYPGQVGVLQSQQCGSSLLWGLTGSAAHLALSVEKIYSEVDLFGVIKATSYNTSVRTGPSITLDLSKSFSMAPALTGGALSESARAIPGWTFYTDYGVVGPAGLPSAGVELSAGLTARLEIGQYVVSYNTLAVTLADPVAINRLTGRRAIRITVIGTGSAFQPTGSITITPPSGHSINGLAADATLTLSNFGKPAMLQCIYQGGTSWKIVDLGVTASNTTYARLVANGAQALTTSYANISMTLNAGADWNASAAPTNPNSYVVPTTGLYEVRILVSATITTAGTLSARVSYYNQPLFDSDVVAGTKTVSGQNIISATAGDVFSLQVKGTAVGNLINGTSGTSALIRKLT